MTGRLTISTTNFISLKMCVKRRQEIVKKKEVRKELLGYVAIKGGTGLEVTVKQLTPLFFSCQISNNEWWSVEKWIWRTGAGVLLTPILEPSLSCEKAHSSQMRKPLEWRRRKHPMQLHNDVKWSKEFSSASSYSENPFRQATNIFASCCWPFVEIIVGRYWLPPLAEKELIYSSLHHKSSRRRWSWSHNDVAPSKYTSNPTVFIDIFFFREHRSARNKKIVLPAAVPSMALLLEGIQQ